MFVPDQHDIRVRQTEFFDHFCRAVAAAIVNDDHLTAVGLLREIIDDVLKRLGETPLFVIGRNDDAEKGARTVSANDVSPLLKWLLFYLEKQKTQASGR